MRPLLIALDVDLVLVAAAVIVFGRRRWLRRQPGEFAGAIRAPGGVVGGLKWRRGSGRWVRDVLAWSRARLIFRNELLAVDWLSREHPEPAGGVKRLGGRAVVIDCGPIRLAVCAGGLAESGAYPIVGATGVESGEKLCE
jgi:hypothetical protein